MAKKPHNSTVKPRKSPRQRRSEATVDSILEAAARILETHGFAGYTTNAVASLAGVSIGSLYQYFPTKEAITASLITRESKELWQDIAAIDLHADGQAPLHALVQAAVEHQLKRPALARILDLEEVRLSEPGSANELNVELAGVVRHCIVAAGYSADSPHKISDVVAIIKGMVDGAGQRGETDKVALAKRVGHAVLGYLICSN
ncbi:TetR/AcrR family transcriptional regulator [Saccharospirillum mangrovi]|uniref:TetR/AcrR family transcriptional regulator n=1 Tax=Saccharospirillum mangrovi TaxID=2161747 RepID=UPI000D35B0F9|nr:TetR/AcrR family transcriptional regulator [Saccharospirillum mangrovi]